MVFNLLFYKSKATQIFWAQNGHNPKQATKRKPPKRLFRRFKFGSPSWARTSDLRINSPSLYRLSYQGYEDLIIRYFDFLSKELARLFHN